jgi:pyruvate/2-oxoglutarate dehydrogenase complex dihydrolipoamide dehydrogenase (E3) component
LTNESVFELTECPDHLVVIGGGPIGVELAQAYRRLGAKVTVIEMATILSRDDADAVEVVRTRLLAEGVDVREGMGVTKVSAQGNGVEVTLSRPGNGATNSAIVQGSHLLVAVGRRPVFNKLELDAAGIAYSNQGIQVDRRLRTTNKRVFAIGDVIDSYRFTHVANYHAGIVIKNALFRWPSRVNYDAVPWVSYADPELAQVGLTEAEARAQDPKARVLSHPFADNDRAQAERETEGFIKVVIGRKGRVLGATIVGAGAGEMILPWVMAIDQGLKIGAMAGLIVPYPTLSEVSKRVASSYFTPTLFGDRTRRLVRFLSRLP